MDLEQALRTVNEPLRLPGTSNTNLVSSVVPGMSTDRASVREVAELDGGPDLRAADALLSLAVATRPQYSEDVYGVHQWWALFRYLGVFDERKRGLALSAAGRGVAGNQRRVLSEELGIAFAVCLAKDWWKIRRGAADRTLVVDVDHLLNSPLASMASVAVEGRRPDYLLVALGPDADVVAPALLECKGTKSRRHVTTQLASACDQIAGLTVGGQELPGLAVSTLLGSGAVEYFALQRSPRDRRSKVAEHQFNHMLVTQLPVDDWPAVSLSGQSDAFSSIDEARFRASRTPDSLSALVEPALAASWGVLADLAGNERAARRWSTSGNVPPGRIPRPRDTFSAPDGGVIVGDSNVVPLPDGRLRIVVGVLAEVDEALAAGDSSEIVRAQRTAADDRRRDDVAAADVAGGVAAYGDDGSALLLLAE